MSAGNAEADMPAGNSDMYTAGYTVGNNNTVTGDTADTNIYRWDYDRFLMQQ
ncbi:hypothetical protein Q4R86_06185 [Morganella morganii]|uniref:hypothetical protein n=1 Tax=Morganella morganii TaxID=582 RepID=UPI0031A30FDB